MLIKLPIDDFIPSVLDYLKNSNSLIIKAEPGAGKTTRLPSAISKIINKKILVLEPRRIAAISAAHRIAEENQWTLGKEVGYQIRFENKFSSDTKIIFITEALLLRKMLRDPELKDIGCVILDEFHERSVHVDLALAALKELQELARPDLKIIVMSATLDSSKLATYLNAKTLDIPGKVFPLDVKYEKSPQLLLTNHLFIERFSKLIFQAFQETLGDILCFLPGKGEIERVKEKLFEYPIKVEILPLHGQLSIQEQERALIPTKNRRIILSTNVAESSLTVEGVSVVVDSGLARILEVHPRTGYESMELVRISKASAKQRAGRAARSMPGVVYKAWNSMDELSMREFDEPEIHRTDLSESILLLSSLGIQNPKNFSWFEQPKEKSLEAAQNFLLAIDAIDSSGALTNIGKEIRNFPLHPRLAKLLFSSREKNAELACKLAAVLSNPIKTRSYEAENDIVLDWQKNNWLLEQTYQNLLKFCKQDASIQDISIEELLIEAYPDRLCKRRSEGAKMAGGRGVKLHSDSNVKTSEYFLAIELKEGRESSDATVFKAIGLSKDLVEKYFLPKSKKVSKLLWDEEKGRFWTLESNDYKGIAIGVEHKRPATALEVEGKLGELLFERFDSLLRNERLAQWFRRVDFLHQFKEFPLLNMEQIKNALDFAAFGESSVAAVADKDLINFFEAQLDQAHLSALNTQCPEYWIVPTGNKIKITYSKEQGAQTEVRLQEIFGLKEVPKIVGQPLTLILLAPNYRPVQVTRDLLSFWSNGYLEVRKELRSRYPKHSWPEDPLTAAPQAKGRSTNAPRMSQ